MFPINPSNLEELRRYVTAKDGEARFGPTTLSLTVSHSNLKQRWIEIRFDVNDTVAHVKEKLYAHGGTQPTYQKLQLLDSQGNLICEMNNEQARLKDYNVVNGNEIRIVDLDSHSLAKSGWLEDVSLVEKYVMPDDVYDAREGTVRKYKEKMHQQMMQNQNEASNKQETNENIKVGSRCEVFPGGRRGIIKYVGAADIIGPGTWVGVELDEPLGKNDGSVKNRRFFTCRLGYGVMTTPDKVTVGDFPIRSLSDDSSDDEI